MPIYEYQCKECGKEFEYQQRMSDPPKTECESCGGRIERLISRSSFSFKGGGWYKDLYSSPKPKSDSSGSGGSDSSSGSSGSGSSGSSESGGAKSSQSSASASAD